jgi:hypothetical protein
VLFAGVVPHLRAGLKPTAPPVPASPRARAAALAERAPYTVAVFSTWRDAPLRPLAVAIHAAVVDATGAEVAPWDEQEPLVDAIRRWTHDIQTLLVILDQFEEYFLYHPSESGPGSFDGVFPQLVNEPNLRVNFLIALREDAWSRLDRFKGRIPILFDNYLRVDYLSRERAREAIEGPRVARRPAPRHPPQPVPPTASRRPTSSSSWSACGTPPRPRASMS